MALSVHFYRCEGCGHTGQISASSPHLQGLPSSGGPLVLSRPRIKFHVGDKETIAARFDHHNNIQNLWERHLRPACQRGTYPFNEGSQIKDFEPIFNSLIKNGIKDPFDEAWPSEFIPHIVRIIGLADAAKHTDPYQASQYYFRAAALCHIARYPVLCSPLRRAIWSLQKSAFLSATSVWQDPPRQILIPHGHASTMTGDGMTIPILYRHPASTLAPTSEGVVPVPVIIQITGLDGFRGDTPPPHTKFFQAQKWATIGIEIPGTGDSPAAPQDPESPDRLYSSLLDWIDSRPELDSSRIAVWGYSTGAYYALRLAHTHARRLKGVIAQGTYCHHALSPEWIERMDGGEYHCSLSRALQHKYGYAFLDEMEEDCQSRFSLVYNGILDMENTKLLLLNGREDTIYPIEDTELVMHYPGDKEVWIGEGLGHMGEPGASKVGLPWLAKLLGPTGVVANGESAVAPAVPSRVDSKAASSPKPSGPHYRPSNGTSEHANGHRSRLGSIANILQGGHSNGNTAHQRKQDEHANGGPVGLINEYANGHSNGHTSGHHVNGHSNGHTLNGHPSNGHSLNGQSIHGHVNGLSAHSVNGHTEPADGIILNGKMGHENGKPSPAAAAAGYEGLVPTPSEKNTSHGRSTSSTSTGCHETQPVLPHPHGGKARKLFNIPLRPSMSLDDMNSLAESQASDTESMRQKKRKRWLNSLFSEA